MFSKTCQTCSSFGLVMLTLWSHLVMFFWCSSQTSSVWPRYRAKAHFYPTRPILFSRLQWNVKTTECNQLLLLIAWWQLQTCHDIKHDQEFGIAKGCFLIQSGEEGRLKFFLRGKSQQCFCSSSERFFLRLTNGDISFYPLKRNITTFSCQKLEKCQISISKETETTLGPLSTSMMVKAFELLGKYHLLLRREFPSPRLSFVQFS